MHTSIGHSSNCRMLHGKKELWELTICKSKNRSNNNKYASFLGASKSQINFCATKICNRYWNLVYTDCIDESIEIRIGKKKDFLQTKQLDMRFKCKFIQRVNPWGFVSILSPLPNPEGQKIRRGWSDSIQHHALQTSHLACGMSSNLTEQMFS